MIEIETTLLKKNPSKTENMMKKSTFNYIMQTHLKKIKNEDGSTWFLDTRATHHLAYRKDWLDNYQELPMPLKVTFGDNHKKVAVGRGNIKLKFISNHMYKFQIYTLYRELQKSIISRTSYCKRNDN